MQFQVGKFYKTRDGRKAEITKIFDTSVHYNVCGKLDGCYEEWSNEGNYFYSGPNPKDLVEEWIKEETPMQSEIHTTRPGNICDALQALAKGLKVWDRYMHELILVGGIVHTLEDGTSYPVIPADTEPDAFQIEVLPVVRLGTGKVRRARYSNEHPDIEMIHVGTATHSGTEWHMYITNTPSWPLSYWDYLGDSNPMWIKDGEDAK